MRKSVKYVKSVNCVKSTSLCSFLNVKDKQNNLTDKK